MKNLILIAALAACDSRVPDLIIGTNATDAVAAKNVAGVHKLGLAPDASVSPSGRLVFNTTAPVPGRYAGDVAINAIEVRGITLDLVAGTATVQLVGISIGTTSYTVGDATIVQPIEQVDDVSRTLVVSVPVNMQTTMTNGIKAAITSQYGISLQ